MSRDRRFVRMAITPTIRMVARLTATTVRAGLRMESLSALGPGTTDGDIRITDAASAIAVSMGAGMNADMIVAGALGAGSKDAVATKARAADFAAANLAVVVVASTVAADRAVADAGNGLQITK